MIVEAIAALALSGSLGAGNFNFVVALNRTIGSYSLAVADDAIADFRMALRSIENRPIGDAGVKKDSDLALVKLVGLRVSYGRPFTLDWLVGADDTPRFSLRNFAKVRPRFIEPDMSNVDEYISHESRRPASVVKGHSKHRGPFEMKVPNCGVSACSCKRLRRQNPSPQVRLHVDAGEGGSGPRLEQVPNQKTGPQQGEEGRDPRRRYLFFGGIGSPYLGLQIFGIMLAGLGFASGAAFGLFRCFENDSRRWRWLALSFPCMVLGLTFYGWGWLGHPLRLWGLA